MSVEKEKKYEPHLITKRLRTEKVWEGRRCDHSLWTHVTSERFELVQLSAVAAVLDDAQDGVLPPRRKVTAASKNPGLDP